MSQPNFQSEAAAGSGGGSEARDRAIAQRDFASLRRIAEDAGLEPAQRSALLLLADMMEVSEKKGERRLLCVAFINQLPIAWKCTHCKWLFRLEIADSQFRYNYRPPENIVEAFRQHHCAEHNK